MQREPHRCDLSLGWCRGFRGRPAVRLPHTCNHNLPWVSLGWCMGRRRQTCVGGWRRRQQRISSGGRRWAWQPPRPRPSGSAAPAPWAVQWRCFACGARWGRAVWRARSKPAAAALCKPRQLPVRLWQSSGKLSNGKWARVGGLPALPAAAGAPRGFERALVPRLPKLSYFVVRSLVIVGW